MRLSANRSLVAWQGAARLVVAAVLALGATLLVAPAEAGAAGNVIKQLDWVVQNDTVMGGRSRPTAWAAAAAGWTGNLSLENNGGFVSILRVMAGLIGPTGRRGGDRGRRAAVQVTLQRGDRVVRGGTVPWWRPSRAANRVTIPSRRCAQALW